MAFADKLKAILASLQGGVNNVMLGSPQQVNEAPSGTDLASAGIAPNEHPQGFAQNLAEFARRRGTARLGELGGRKQEQERQSGLALKEAQTAALGRQNQPAAAPEPPSVKEYLFYASDEIKAGRQPKSYDEWQTSDANRKNPIQRNIDPNSPEGIAAQLALEKGKSGLRPEPTPATSIQEYKFYVDEETKAGRTPKSYDAWQTEDANRKKVAPPGEAGTYIPLTDDQGRVIGAWNPKSQKVEKVPGELAGARRTAVPAGVNAKIADYENAYRKIGDLQAAYKPEFVGPFQGRYERSKATGILSVNPLMSTPEGYGDFLALSSDLENSIIKLITGAQMGVQEADRIRRQIPLPEDKDDIWKSKYEQTKKNADFLMNRIKELSGAGGAPGAPPNPGVPPPTVKDPKSMSDAEILQELTK